MKEFLSNAWVVSIISGIIVFFLTNAIIIFQNRRKHKKQINDANTTILNRLRGYVVDNGLPQREVINAVKSSTAREYNVKYDELLKIKEFCEELITDIIGNIYISNENKVKYIDMLQDYLKENSNAQEDLLIDKEIEKSSTKKVKKSNNYLEITFSIISAAATFIVAYLLSLDTEEMSNIYAAFIATITIIAIFVMVIFIFPIIGKAFDLIDRLRK